MKTFLIDSENNITAYASDADARFALTEGAIAFSTHADLTRDAASWPTSRLVEVWNTIPGVIAVTRFTDRKTAITRIWNAIQNLEPTPAPPPSPVVAPLVRQGTKKATVLALLQRPDGASVQEIMTALGWQSHSVRGFLSTLNKRGTAVHSFKRTAGDRAYRMELAAAGAAREAQ